MMFLEMSHYYYSSCLFSRWGISVINWLVVSGGGIKFILPGIKTKKNSCFMSPKSMSGQAILSLMRQSWSESEQFWALLTLEVNPYGKTTRHWLWKVKDIPCVTQSGTQVAAARTWTWVILGRSKCFTTAPPSLWRTRRVQAVSSRLLLCWCQQNYKLM